MGVQEAPVCRQPAKLSRSQVRSGDLFDGVQACESVVERLLYVVGSRCVGFMIQPLGLNPSHALHKYVESVPSPFTSPFTHT